VLKRNGAKNGEGHKKEISQFLPYLKVADKNENIFHLLRRLVFFRLLSKKAKRASERSVPSPASIGLFSLAFFAFKESTESEASERAKRTISCVDWSLTHLIFLLSHFLFCIEKD
jgi:hypothetical protein